MSEGEMQSIPDGVDLYVHRLIHESLMKEVIREYHSLYACGTNHHLYFKYDYSSCANYRHITSCLGGYNVHRVLFNPRDREDVKLPKRYFFSSGMNSLTGYNNE